MDNNNILVEAKQIAKSLHSAEDQIEGALGNIADLLITMPKLKVAASLTIFHGQEVLESAQEVLSALTIARRRVSELHRKLELTQKQIGLHHVAFGPVGKPPAAEINPAMRDIRAVA